jgi:hypothetical protein
MNFYLKKKKFIDFIIEHKKKNIVEKNRNNSTNFAQKNTVTVLNGINSLYKISFFKKKKGKVSFYYNIQSCITYEKSAILCLSWKKFNQGKSATYCSSHFLFFKITYIQLIDKLYNKNHKDFENFFYLKKNFYIKSNFANLKPIDIRDIYDKNHIEYKINIFMSNLFFKIPKII